MFFAACNPASGDKTPVEKTAFKTATVASGFDHPWAVGFLSNKDFLVTERGGKLWRVSAQGYKKEVTGVPQVLHAGQGGLLDIAVEPDFKDGGWIYLSYAATDNSDKDKANTEIMRARFDTQRNRLYDNEVIFRAMPKVKGSNHFGSRLLLDGPDILYATLGERFDYEDEAQNLQAHLGKVIRIHTDGRIPSDNPFAGGPSADDAVFTYGHRNAQGMIRHPDTGRIWINEHGPRGGDEVNILKAGANYGWPKVTHGVAYTGLTISDKKTAEGMEDPVHVWTPSIAPSGMVYYTGTVFPQWRGSIFHGALAFKNIYRQVYDENGRLVTEEKLWPETYKRIRDIRQSPDGYLYILTDEGGGEDQLIRLEPAE